MRARMLLLALAVCCSPVAAIENVPNKPGLRQPGDNHGPPFSVGDMFIYRLMPQGIHAFLCSQPSCGPGSKVSYTLLPPKERVSFSQYKEERKIVEKELRKHMPKGVTMRFKPPTQQKDKMFTVYESRRTAIDAEGNKTTFISRRIQGSSVIIDLISSGPDEKLAEEHSNAFMIAGLVFDFALKEKNKKTKK